jgi:hypothetical protein
MHYNVFIIIDNPCVPKIRANQLPLTTRILAYFGDSVFWGQYTN